MLWRITIQCQTAAIMVVSYDLILCECVPNSSPLKVTKVEQLLDSPATLFSVGVFE